jgi:predicted nucleic acid-binding Zn ribbon protein
MSTWRPHQTPPSELDPRRLVDSLDVVARRIGAPPTEVLTTVFAHWVELVGDDIAAHATPKLLRGGVLTVVVDHPAWATQLRFLSATLLEQIRRRTGAPEEICSIRIQVGDSSDAKRRRDPTEPDHDDDLDPNRPKSVRRRVPPRGQRNPVASRWQDRRRT